MKHKADQACIYVPSVKYSDGIAMYSALPAYNSHAHYELILSHRNAFLYRYEELLYQFTFLRWFVAFVENKRKCVAVMSDVCLDEMMIISVITMARMNCCSLLLSLSGYCQSCVSFKLYGVQI